MSTRRAAWAWILLAALLVAAGCGSSRAGSVVSVRGSVGPLRVDRSGRAQVVAYAGKPDADLHGRGDNSRYEVLGYGCPGHIPPLRDYLIDCGTAYYLVGGKLGLFGEALVGEPRCSNRNADGPGRTAPAPQGLRRLRGVPLAAQ